MKSLQLSPLFLLSAFPLLLDYVFGMGDLSFCFGQRSICDAALDLNSDCSSISEFHANFKCLCENGYAATNEACYWCQLAYDLNPLYTTAVPDTCRDDGVEIAPIPASVLSIESKYNATYTGVISSIVPTGPLSTSSPPVTTTDASGATTTGGGRDPYASQTDSSEPASAPDSSDPVVITETAGSTTSTHKPTSTAANGNDNAPVTKNSSGGGLSTGAKAGIGIGCALVAVLIGVLIWIAIILSRKSKNKRLEQQQVQQTQQFLPNQHPHNQNPPGMAEMGDSNVGHLGPKPSSWGWGFLGKHNHDQKPVVQTSPSVQSSTLAPSAHLSTMSPVSENWRQSSVGWPGGQTVSPHQSPGEMAAPIPAAAVYSQQNPPVQNQYPPPQQGQYAPPQQGQYPPPQNQYSPPPPQQNQYSPLPQNQYSPPPQQTYYPPPPQQQQPVYQTYNPPPTELQGSHVAPGAGLPPDGRSG